MARAVLFVVVAVACFPPLQGSPNINLGSGLKKIYSDLQNLTKLSDKLRQAKQFATSMFQSSPLNANGAQSSVSHNTQWPLQTVTFSHPIQSPVNIMTKNAITMALPYLVMKQSNLDGVKAKFYNSGHTAYVYMNEENKDKKPYMVGGPLPGKFIFEQMHFHWGAEDVWGSEHFIDGESKAVEMHLVHWNSKYSNFTEASTEKDGLAVMCIFAEVDQSEDNVLLEPLHSLLTNISKAESAAYLDSVEAMQWAGSALSTNTEYYAYPGSLTTPPYSENVIFIVLPKPITLSSKQLSSFRALHSKEHGQILDNKRQLQPLHNRPIVRSTYL